MWSENVKAFSNAAGTLTEVLTAGLGGEIYDFAAVDTSGDGKDDLFLSEYKDDWDYVSVAYSNASNTLDASFRLIEGAWTTMFGGNFDGISAEDIVFNDLYFFKGGENPDATRNFTFGDAPGAIAIGDFNNDTKPDLVTFLNTDEEMSVALGTGPWTYGAPTKTDVGISDAVGAEAADLDADGNLDIVLQESSVVYVLYGDGTGSFAAPFEIENGFDYVILNADLDAELEVAITDEGADLVHVYDATDGSIADYTLEEGPHGIDAADFDGDGRIDLAVSTTNSQELKILLNDVTLGFRAGTTIALPEMGWHVACGDFDADGFQDVAVSFLGSDVWMFPGDGTGSFGAANVLTTPFFSDMEAQDLNGDGAAELIALEGNAAFLYVFNGDEDPLATRKMYPAAMYSTGITIGDADGDGNDDIAVGNEAESGTGDLILIWKNLTSELE